MPILAIGLDARPATAGAQEFKRATDEVKASAKDAAGAAREMSDAQKEAGESTKKAAGDIRAAEKDAAGFGKTARDAGKSAVDMGEGANKAARGARSLTDDTSRATKAVKEGSDAARAADVVTRKLTDTEDKAAKSAKEFGEATRKAFSGTGSHELERATEAVSELEAKIIRGLGPGAGVLKSIGIGAGSASSGLESLAASAGLGAGALSGIAVGVGGLLAVGEGIKFVTEKSLEFDEALKGVNARLDTPNVQAYRDQLRSLSSAAGTSLKEIAEGAGQAVTSGFGDAASSLKFLAEAARLAKANVVPLSDSVRILDDTMDAFGVHGDRAAEIAEKLTVGARLGQTSFAGFASAVAQVGTVAGPLGVSLEEVAAVLSSATRAGVREGEAATGLRSVLLKLQDPTDQLTLKLRALGVDTGTDAVRAKGLIGVLGDIRTAIGDNPARLAELFGSPRTAAAVFAAVRDSATGAAAALKTITHESEEVEKALSRVEGTASAKLDILKNQFSNFATGVGDKFSGLLVSILEGLAGETIKAPKIELPPDLGSDVAKRYIKDIGEAFKDGDAILAQNLTEMFQRAVREARADLKNQGLKPEDVIKSSEFLQKVNPDIFKTDRDRLDLTREAALALTDVGPAVAQVTAAMAGQFVKTEAGIKKLASAVTTEAGKIRLGFESIDPATLGPFSIAPKIDDTAVQREAKRVLSKLQPIEIPFAPVALPADIEKARATLEKFKDTPNILLQPDQEKAFSEALAAVQKFIQAQQQAKKLQDQLIAQSATGLDKEIAGYRAAESAVSDTIDQIEELLGKSPEVEALRKALQGVRDANSQSADKSDASRRAQIAGAIAALEGQVTAAKLQALVADARLADSEEGRAKILQLRLSALDSEADQQENAIRVQGKLQDQSAEAIERQVLAVRERTRIEKESAGRDKGDADRAAAVERSGKVQERNVEIGNALAQAEETRLHLLGEVSTAYGDQTASLEGLRRIERDRLQFQISRAGELLVNQKQILSLYDQQTDRLRAQQSIQQSDKRHSLKDDLQLALDTQKEVDALGLSAADAADKFDHLFRSRRDMRDAVATGVGSFRSELDQAGAGMESLGDAAINVGRTIQKDLFDRIVSQPLSELFGKGLDGVLGGFGGGKKDAESGAADALKSAVDPAAAAVSSLSPTMLELSAATTTVPPALLELATSAGIASAALAQIGGKAAVPGFAGLFGGGGGSPDPGSAINSHALALGGGVSNQQFASGASVSSYSENGIFNRRTEFPMASGTGVAGEAGTEYVFPAKRGADGKLGVAMTGGSMGQQTVNNYSTRMTVYARDANSFRSSEKQILSKLRGRR